MIGSELSEGDLRCRAVVDRAAREVPICAVLSAATADLLGARSHACQHAGMSGSFSIAAALALIVTDP